MTLQNPNHSHPYNNGDVVRIKNPDLDTAERQNFYVELAPNERFIISMEKRSGRVYAFSEGNFDYDSQAKSFEVRSPVSLRGTNPVTANLADHLVKNQGTIAGGKIDFEGAIFKDDFYLQ